MKGLRYRLMSLKDLHEKYLVGEDYQCSYAQFTSYVLDSIIKPKPEDWGTCLNPKLKFQLNLVI